MAIGKRISDLDTAGTLTGAELMEVSQSSTSKQLALTSIAVPTLTNTWSAIQTYSSHILMLDNAEVRVGTGSDLVIVHNGTNTSITNVTGALNIVPTTGNVVALGLTGTVNVTSDGRLYGSALHNNAGAVTGTTNQYVASGTYTPTATLVTNAAAATPSASRWIRVGNVVVVAGRVAITATAGSSALTLGMSLPIASDIAGISDLSGCGARQDGTSNMPITIGGDLTNNRANFVFYPENTNAYDYNYTFAYTVL